MARSVHINPVTSPYIARVMMRSIDATVTSQGQVTIPAEVRLRLGLKPREKVTFLLDHDAVRLVPARYTLETAFGAVNPIPGMSADFDDEIEDATAEALIQGRCR
ncbi:MAG TPA: AbrB/MazE/SpoVT family DNA-binding domain-containing protein [Thermomicrobiales bacterium]|nr:AbrB/MazE/SpoVT family DNA-binding domain-containing protein [Thermomicrobiales bacterium]